MLKSNRKHSSGAETPMTAGSGGPRSLGADHRERPVPTHYEVLGVDPGADTETIRRAYLMVAKATHPDRRQSDDPERVARAEEHIRLANAAWNVLRDTERCS
jgi:DnaJ-class molecular chaperone